VFSILSGFSKAICDLSEEGKLKGGSSYWHKNKSWKNKWKNGDKKQGEKFWLSSTIFVLFTDAWHLFGLLERIGFIVSYITIGMLITISDWYWFMLSNYLFSMMIFHLFYNSKLLRK
jgi:hypothetical protein